MSKTLYVYTGVTKHNGHIDVFAHMLTVDDDGNWEDTDYGRRTYIGYSRNDAALDYISNYVGDDALEAKIVIRTF